MLGLLAALTLPRVISAQSSARPIVVATINGPINPATDDYLRTTLARAEKENAALFVLRLNTPGGLLTSMQKMVEALLEAPVPTVVYVTPAGAGATSAGVFVTLAANVAAMAPGTTIGAAHPVLGGGTDVKGDMGAKIENFTASLIRAIAEQRGRNVKWAEQAVRESVSITDRQAVEEKVVDLVASDLDKLLADIEGRTVTVTGRPVTLRELKKLPLHYVDMNFRQSVVNVLSDPNVAILLGLGAMLGLGIEFYHPGAVFPGVAGAICLVLSLTAAQVLPISIGGLVLLLLSAVFFVVELFMPTFGIWGSAGIVCLVLGSIYFIDSDMVWSESGFAVNKTLVGSIAALVGSVLALVCYLAVKSQRSRVTTGKEGLLGKRATVKVDFVESPAGVLEGKVEVMGEIWKARAAAGGMPPKKGQKLEVVELQEGLTLVVKELPAQNE